MLHNPSCTLLLNFDEGDYGSPVDTSVNGRTTTTNGAYIHNTAAKYGLGGLLCGGDSGTPVYTHLLVNSPAGVFTTSTSSSKQIDIWFRPDFSCPSGINPLFSVTYQNNDYFTAWFGPTSFEFKYSGTNTSGTNYHYNSSAFYPTYGQWYHFRILVSSTKLRWWLGGVFGGFITHTGNIWVGTAGNPVTEFKIGAYPTFFNQTDKFFCGAIGSVYVSDGDNLWVRDIGFCPPKQKHVGVAEYQYPYNEATVFLLKQSYADGTLLSVDQSRYAKPYQLLSQVWLGGIYNSWNGGFLFGSNTAEGHGGNTQSVLKILAPEIVIDTSLPSYYSREFRANFVVLDQLNTTYHYLMAVQFALSNYAYYCYVNGIDGTLILHCQDEMGAGICPDIVYALPGYALGVEYKLRIVWKFDKVYMGVNGVAAGSSTIPGATRFFDGVTNGVTAGLYVGNFAGSPLFGVMDNIEWLVGDESWFGGAYVDYDVHACVQYDVPNPAYIPETSLLLPMSSSPIGDKASGQHAVITSGDVAYSGSGGVYGGGYHTFNAVGTTGTVTPNFPNPIWSSSPSGSIARHIEVLFHPNNFWYGQVFNLKHLTGFGSLYLYLSGESELVVYTTDALGNGTSVSASNLVIDWFLWTHVRIQLYDSKILLGVNGVYVAELTPGWDVWPNGTSIGALQVGNSEFLGNNPYIGQLAHFAMYEGLPPETLGLYDMPRVPRANAQLPGPVSAYPSGILQSYAQGGFQLGVPVNVSVPGVVQEYYTPTLTKYQSPTHRNVYRQQPSKRLSSRNLLTYDEASYGIASEFWEVPPAPSANVSLGLAGADWVLSLGDVTASNPGRTITLASNVQGYVQGAFTVTIASYSVVLNGLVQDYNQGAVSTATAYAQTLAGSTYGYSQGSLAIALSVAIPGIPLTYSQGVVGAAWETSQQSGGEGTFTEFPASSGDIVFPMVATQEEWQSFDGYEMYVQSRIILSSERISGGVEVAMADLVSRQAEDGITPMLPDVLPTSSIQRLPIPIYTEISISNRQVDLVPLLPYTLTVAYDSALPATTYPVQYRMRLTREAAAHTGSIDFSYSLYSPTGQWSIDILYGLETTSGIELKQSSVNLLYGLEVFPKYERSIDIGYSLLVPQLNVWQIDITYPLGTTMFEIDFKWAISPSTYMTEMLGYVNAERAAVGRTAMYRLYDEVGPDVATIHADHIRDLSVYAHESPLFPEGWRTINERQAQLMHQHGNMSENIQWKASTLPLEPNITAYDVFLSWKNSPPHYANMIHEWPETSDVAMIVGAAYFHNGPVYLEDGVTETWPYYSDVFMAFFVQNFIDMNLPGGGQQMQFVQNMKWTAYGAPLASVPMLWGLDAYKHVAARHAGSYSIKVSAQHDSLYGCRAAVTHSAPQHYTISADHLALYEPMGPVSRAHAGTYDLDEYLNLVKSHSAVYGLQVGRSHGGEYADMATARASHAAKYESLSVLAKAMAALYGDSDILSASHASIYSLQSPVAGKHVAVYDYRVMATAAHVAVYGDQIRVVKQFNESYDLLVNQPVKAHMRAYYSLLGPDVTEMIDLPSEVSVLFGGTPAEYEDAEVSTSEDEYVWVGKVTLADPAQYAGIAIDSPMTIVLGGVTYNLIVTGKTLGRDSPATVNMEVTGHSKNIRFTEPRASTISYTLDTPKLASVLASELVGVPVIWEIVDWLIPALYFAVENVTPISALQTIANAAGGIVTSLPTGELLVRYKFPVSVLTYDTGTPDWVLTDAEDNLSCRETINTTDIINKLRIRNGSDNVSDYLEFTLDEGVDDTGTLRAYVLPWRTVELQHTGGAVVALGPLIIESRTESELVEVVGGKASLKYPALAITGEVWKSDSLGPLVLEPRTKEVTTSSLTNYGYGLVEVTYVVECYSRRVQFPVGNVAQFILVDKG